MSFLTIRQIATKEDVARFIAYTEETANQGRLGCLQDKTLINLFYEPSTRTNCSFQAATFKLGGKVIAVSLKDSSVEKGESFEDTVRTLSLYGDALVLRHPAVGSSLAASKISKIPIINAGDGNGEHPTQALLDIFTIYAELKKRQIGLDGICVGFIGDLKNSRTIHSLIYLLKLWNITLMAYCSEKLLYDDPSIQYCYSLHELLRNVDVLYVSRIQKERFADPAEAALLVQEYNYHITQDNIELMKPTAIIMHPLPRNDEISPAVDDNPRCVYFNQVENGVYVRMALLKILLNPHHSLRPCLGLN